MSLEPMKEFLENHSGGDIYALAKSNVRHFCDLSKNTVVAPQFGIKSVLVTN
jgi:hypothetical protein